MNRTTPEIAIWADVRRQPDDRRPPAALLLGAAFLIQLLWVGLGHGVGVGNAVLIGGVAGLAFAISLWLTVPAALLAGGTAFLTIDGFVQGGYGTLTWTGAGDVLLIGALVAGCALLAEAAYEMWWSRPRRSRPTRDTVLTPWWYDDTLVELSLQLSDEGEQAHAVGMDLPPSRPDTTSVRNNASDASPSSHTTWGSPA